MKVRIIALCLFLVCFCTISHAQVNIEFLTDSSSDLKNVLAGLASAVSQSSSINVNNIFNCGFSTISNQLIASIKQIVKDASSCDPDKVSKISAELKALTNSIPESVSTCLETNSDAQALFDGLHLSGKTSSQIQTDVTNWVENNPFTACMDFKGLQKDVSQGNMKKLGADAGALVLQIFSSKASKRKNIWDLFGAQKDDFTQLLAGIATNIQDQVDVTTITACGDEGTFATLEDGLLQVMDEISGCDPSKFEDAANNAIALANEIPDATKQCLSQSVAGKTILSDLGILGLTPYQIKTKIAAYILEHILTICSTLSDLNQKLRNTDFYGFGVEGGQLLRAIFQSSSKNYAEIANNAINALQSAEGQTLSEAEKITELIKSLTLTDDDVEVA